MKITNRHNLPQPFVDLVTHDTYCRGESDYTTTQLIGPPRIDILKERHWDEIEEDASDRVWSMSGSARHALLEDTARVNPERYIAEHRFYLTILGKKVGGQIDLYDRESKTLYDYKETSIWKVKFGDYSEWEAQGNINALLCNEAGIHPEHLVNVAIMKDWKKREMKRKRDYPSCAIQAIPLRLWSWSEAIEYLEDRVRVHEAARSSPNPPICTPKERWRQSDRWAVKKQGNKRALKVYDSEEDAKAHLLRGDTGKNPKPLVLEKREAEDVRCVDYCSVARFCEFGKLALARAEAGDSEDGEE